MPAGRPSIYTQELAELICHRVATNPHGIKTICKMYDDMPNPDTIREWRALHEKFSVLYLQAREKQSHILFESAIDEVEDIKSYVYENDKTGAKCVDAGIVAMQKAIANQKTHQAARISPKQYGDAKQLEETKADNEKLKQELAELRARLDAQHKSEY